MLEFSLYVNVLLFFIGILLIYALITKKKEHPVLLRAVLMAYFLVVLQYNAERLRLMENKALLASAAVVLIVWVRQPIPATEEL